MVIKYIKRRAGIALGVLLFWVLYHWFTAVVPDTEAAKKKPIMEKRSPLAPTEFHKLLKPAEAKTKTFSTLADAQSYMKLCMELAEPQKVIIHYHNFSIKLPQFADKADKELFLKSSRNRENLKATKAEQLVGEVEIIANGTYQQPFDCGFKSNYDAVKVERVPFPNVTYKYLAPIVVPHAFGFQHFYDGLLPKLLQSYPLLLNPEVKILTERPRHENINAILQRLNLTMDKFVWYQPRKPEPIYYANYMIMTCVTPPLHPALWQDARTKLGVPSTLPRDKSDTRVMLLTRAGAQKTGRNIINQHDIETFLSARYGQQLIKFNDFPFDEALNIFRSVRIIIGVHGGAFYNMNYAPKETTVIEVGPTLDDGRDIGLPHAIFWAMAELLGQPYWRIPAVVSSGSANVHVDLDKLRRVLDKVDQQYV